MIGRGLPGRQTPRGETSQKEITVNFETFLSLLPWLGILACPVMMLFMMRGMSHSGPCCVKSSQGKPDDGVAQVTSSPLRSREEEVRALQDALARLKEQECLAGRCHEPVRHLRHGRSSGRR